MATCLGLDNYVDSNTKSEDSQDPDICFPEDFYTGNSCDKSDIPDHEHFAGIMPECIPPETLKKLLALPPEAQKEDGKPCLQDQLTETVVVNLNEIYWDTYTAMRGLMWLGEAKELYFHLSLLGSGYVDVDHEILLKAKQILAWLTRAAKDGWYIPQAIHMCKETSQFLCHDVLVYTMACSCAIKHLSIHVLDIEARGGGRHTGDMETIIHFLVSTPLQSLHLHCSNNVTMLIFLVMLKGYEGNTCLTNLEFENNYDVYTPGGIKWQEFDWLKELVRIPYFAHVHTLTF